MNFNSILTIAAKNAVNAALVTLVPILRNPAQYNFHSWDGIQHIGVMLLGAIVAREAIVWVPKILAWSQTIEGQSVIEVNPK